MGARRRGDTRGLGARANGQHSLSHQQREQALIGHKTAGELYGLTACLWNRFHQEKGQNLIEYAMLFALIALVVILAVAFFGREMSRTIARIGTIVQGWPRGDSSLSLDSATTAVRAGGGQSRPGLASSGVCPDAGGRHSQNAAPGILLISSLR